MGQEKERCMRIKFNRRTGSSRTVFCTGCSLSSTLDMRPSRAVKPSFPLTLTLSLGESTCLAWSLRDRTERGVYAASASRSPVTLRNSPSARKVQTVKRPEGRAPAQPQRNACFAHTGLANSVAGMAERRGTILPLPRYLITVAQIFNLLYRRFVIGRTLLAGGIWQV